MNIKLGPMPKWVHDLETVESKSKSPSIDYFINHFKNQIDKPNLVIEQRMRKLAKTMTHISRRKLESYHVRFGFILSIFSTLRNAWNYGILKNSGIFGLSLAQDYLNTHPKITFVKQKENEEHVKVKDILPEEEEVILDESNNEYGYLTAISETDNETDEQYFSYPEELEKEAFETLPLEEVTIKQLSPKEKMKLDLLAMWPHCPEENVEASIKVWLTIIKEAQLIQWDKINDSQTYKVSFECPLMGEGYLYGFMVNIKLPKKLEITFSEKQIQNSNGYYINLTFPKKNRQITVKGGILPEMAVNQISSEVDYSGDIIYTLNLSAWLFSKSQTTNLKNALFFWDNVKWSPQS